MTHSCPVCGGPLLGDDTQWIKAAAVFVWPRGAARFTPDEASMFDRLWRARDGADAVPREALIESVWSDSSDGGPDCADRRLKVMACHMRKKIEGSGVTIKGVWGVGYRLEAALI